MSVTMMIKKGQPFKMLKKAIKNNNSVKPESVSPLQPIVNRFKCKFNFKLPRIRKQHQLIRMRWEIFIIFCGIYIILMTPLLSTFFYHDLYINGSKDDKYLYESLTNVGYVFDCIFFLDFLKNFLITYIDEDKQLEE
jgi:hypothetical protein